MMVKLFEIVQEIKSKKTIQNDMKCDYSYLITIESQQSFNNQREMSLSIFAIKNAYHKNGIWWFTKMLNRVVGQQRYDAIRVQRRVYSNKFYYLRQQVLYRWFVEHPDLANLLGIYPKVDSSHGFGFYNTYEMYRDFQQNTINSDGSFGMWFSVIASIYIAHELYNYIFPWYWNKTSNCKNGQEERVRMRDALASSILQDSYGIQIAQWGWMPHDFHSIRRRLSSGLSHPDDVRSMAMSTCNRRHRYVEHYRFKIGDEETTMIQR